MDFVYALPDNGNLWHGFLYLIGYKGAQGQIVYDSSII